MSRRPILASLLLASLVTSTRAAQGLVSIEDTEAWKGVRIVRLHADVTVHGPMMQVRQRLVLRNFGSETDEFDLVFPLGRGAAVTELTLEVDGQPFEGSLFDAERARELYRTSMRDPAMFEHYGEALYRARIPQVEPKQERTLLLSYERLVESEGDLRMLHLPLTALRRYAGPFELTIEGEIVTEEPVSTIYSPTHVIDRGLDSASFEATRTLQHTHFTVHTPSEGGETDFLAYFQPRVSDSPFELTLLSERTSMTEDGTFLALIRGRSSDLEEPEPKNVVFVVDRSGSMKLEKIDQAKAALHFLVGKLRPEDRFNIVTYAAEASSFADTLQAPTADVLARAGDYIDAIVADGDTAIEAALRSALSQFTEAQGSDTGLLSQIVFLTDGLPTKGETDERRLCAIVAENNPHDVRIIAFGLGFDVNGALLDRLAAENHGMSEYVLPNQPIQEKVPGFYERMRAPLLLDVNIELSGAPTHDVFPRQLGDLYAGHEVMLVGRYASSGTIEISLSGRRGREPEKHTFRFELAAPDRFASDFAGRLWAAKKVGFLVDELRLSPLETADTGKVEQDPRIKEIVRLGTRYGILTEYTAFLAGEGTDLYAFADNVVQCTAEFEGRTAVTSGTHGVAQACNSKVLQRSGQVSKASTWIGANGEQVTVEGVSCVNGKTFFRRGETWQDAALAAAEVDVTIELFSDEFFGLLDEHPWLGACVARTGELLVDVDGRSVRIQS